ncbi:MAG: sigma-54-dependent Fis family transcriptional regulator [Deltaproteobacteria bacterium]|nr:sigma-54-dependent Fis family transcriptional regulator [Deltaproteobacteria bacterium]
MSASGGNGTVLVVDDERNIRRTLEMILGGEGFDVRTAASGEEALQALAAGGVDVVILDVRLPGMSGLDALARIRADASSVRLPVIMISGHASLQEAVQAVQSGATDFFEKPLDRDRVVLSVRNALRAWRLEREVDRLRAEVGQRYEMIGESPVMRRLYEEIEKVAPTRGRVLITGESGTGKELIARAVHRLSPRRDGPFIKVNCAAIPQDLIESELFGYERGAFTGAAQRKKGQFELANRGTLFLDEIGDMALAAQSKVLRALQSNEITRVGSEQSIEVDVRVIAATNKDLQVEVAKGAFREDLFFRLNVIPLRSPPLRERVEDIPLLVTSFVRDFCAENGLSEKRITPDALAAVVARPWPGNIRELRNVVERMVILSGTEIVASDVPDPPRIGPWATQSAERDVDPDADADDSSEIPAMPERAPGERPTLRDFRDRAEREYILSTLAEVGWNISRAAVLLGVERTNLHKKMRSLDIKR